MTLDSAPPAARAWVGSSWKMNKTRAEAMVFAEGLRAAADQVPAGVVLFVLPPFTSIEPVARILDGTGIGVGAQDVHWEDWGAFTGEVSAPMLAEVGASVAEIGHSERRELFGETDDRVARKLAAAQRHGLVPVVCVGEPWSARESGEAEQFVTAQVRSAVVHARPGAGLRIAYEPVWAIGEHGRPASPGQAEEIHAAIRAALVEALGEAGDEIPVLYGGSVTPDNAADFMAAPSVDGLFVGRAAWSVEGLLAVAAQAAV